MYERFTDRARKVMQLANQEALRFKHEYIGTEHILLGLIKEGGGVAADVLKNLGLDLHTIRLEIEKIILSGPGEVSPRTLPQTPRAKKVIEYADKESRSLSHDYVGTEHLLLGLLREREGVAAQVLMNLGLKLEDAREEIMNLLGANPNVQTRDSKRVAVPPDQYLNLALIYFPEEVIRVFKEVNSYIEKLVRQKEEAVAEQHFDEAALLREKEQQFKRQLLDAVKKLQAFIRDSGNDSK